MILIIMIIIIIYSNALYKLELFHDRLGMAYIQLNINEQNMLLWLHFANKLFITEMLLVTINKMFFKSVFIKACKNYEDKK